MRHKNTKAARNYYVDIVSFVPFLLSILSGIVMLIYHISGNSDYKIIGFGREKWLLAHQILSLIALPFIFLHLSLHSFWLKKLFSLQLKSNHKGKNITLFIVFILCVTTSLLSWLVFKDSVIGNLLRGLHNKLGVIMTLFFILHISAYSKWLINMSRKFFIHS